MKSIIKRSLLFLGGISLAASLVACNGHRAHHDPEQRAEWMIEKITKELELNDVQKQKLAVVKDEFMTIRTTMHEEQNNPREQILELMSQPTLDRQKAMAMVNDRTETIRARAPAMVDAVGNFYDSLDDEQRKELREHFEEKTGHSRFCKHK